MLKVKKIEIHNMWYNNKTIEINFKKKLTFLTGYNGTGKSTILELIYSSLQEGDSPTLKAVDWTTKTTLDGDIIVFNSSFGIDLSSQEKKLQSNIRKTNKAMEATPFSAKRFRTEIFQDLKTNTNDKNQSNVTLSNEDSKENAAKKYLIRMVSTHEDSLYADEPFNTIITPVLFKDERFRIPDRPYTYSDELSVNRELSRGLNKTLKELLIDFLGYESNLNKEKSIESSAETETIINNLQELTYSNEALKGNFEALKDVVIKAMQNMTSNKNPIEDKIKNFENTLNDFFLCTNKKITRDERSFLAFKNESGGIIKWSELSKGEKNLLGIFLLAFLSNNVKTVFILDEPDLSLHIEWQRKLVETITKIAPDSQFIIATHSPAMFINDCDFEVINMKDIII